MNDLSHRIATLSPEERALLELQLKNREAARATRRVIPHRGAIGACPLSFAQQRLWFLDQLEPASPVYNVVKAVRVNGRFDVDVLQQTLDTIVARHEVLRTTFPAVDDNPVQKIAENRHVELTLSDLRILPAGEREVELHRRTTAEARRPFNLAQDLMLRVTVLQLDEQEYVLLFVVHHIAFDGWSIGILFRELVALYTAFSAGQPSPLPELPIQYADFAVWQRQWLQEEELNSQLTYWKRQLGGTLPILEVPTDRPRPAVQAYHGARHLFVLPTSLSKALKTFSRQQRVTLFMALLAAFQTLLRRYTGQDDILVGSPIAGRTRIETELLIGFFVNTLVLRTDLSGNPTFRELLRRVQEVALQAYAHQELPFEKLVEELRPERNLSHSPFFQVMFVLQNTPTTTLNLTGLTVTSLEVDREMAMFDLTLSMVEETNSLRGFIEYNTDLFDAATISRMLGHWQTLLQGIVTNPDQRLSDLPILTEAERQNLLIEWNKTQREYSKDESVHELFQAQVERTPEAMAVVFEDQSLSYRELNARANQLAHYLRKLGVGPDVLVAICLERSMEMVVGILGILKAGGVYVPLDPNYPRERLAFMLEDTQALILLTQRELMENVPNYSGKILCLDSDREDISRESQENLSVQTTSGNLAYVIYTSGSTGQPKGTLIDHSALARHCLDIALHYELSAHDRVLQFASLSFDTALEQLFPTLISGATVILRDTTLWEPHEVLRRLSDLRITVADFPTAYWRQTLQALSQTTKPHDGAIPRLVIAGGEAMVPKDLALWKHTPLSPAQLLNAYGPTETTVTATTFDVVPLLTASQLPARVPIGRPLANRSVFVLDQSRNPVPIGIAGELYIGGAGLARGYLNRPELTAEKFIPDPFSREPGARLYRSGDLARYLPDGNIEFLGRSDHQVKLRGYRIELGEIETILGQHPCVRDTVVLVREDSPGDQRVVAYVVPHGASVSGSELRRFLTTKLPEYMIPTVFVMLDALPVTPNGKIDRQALPRPDHSRPALAEDYVAPQTPVEVLLATIWAEVLKVKRVGIRDNFFALGGHSLLATMVIARINNQFHLEVPLRSLFECQTVAALATLIDEQQGRQISTDALDSLLSDIEALSEQEVETLLATSGREQVILKDLPPG